MAENILGILFVTSTSRGRNVFRYPPDPLSPYPRLSQPIYPSSTYTARDNVFGDVSRRRLFPDSSTAHTHTDARKSSAASGGEPSSAHRSTRLGRAFGASSDGGSGNQRYGGGCRADLPDWGRMEEEEEGADSDGTDDSDEGLYYMGSNRVPLSGKRIMEEVINPQSINEEVMRYADPTKTNTLVNSRAAEGADRTSPRKGDSGRNGNLSSGNAAIVAGQVQVHGAPGVKYDASIESQYSYALGYSLDFLSDMLTPSRAACNRKFELCVDELVFIGHPVTIGADGQWGYPKEAGQAEENGRRNTADEGDRRGRRREAVGHSHLRTVVEGSGSESNSISDIGGGNRDPLANSPEKKRSDANGANGKGKSGDGAEEECPSLDMFHMVLIVDKPDPKTAPMGGTDHIAPSEGFEEIYREIAFKWTAAAYALQVKNNWVARESWEMAKARERSMAEGISVEKCCLSMYRGNPLERALQDLSYNLWKFRTSPVNPLYTHLPTTVTVCLADLPISMILSPRTGASDETWAHWGSGGHGNEYDIESEASSDSGLDLLGERSGGREVRVEPWQTLLLVEDRAKERARETAAAVVGLGNWTPTRPKSGWGDEEEDEEAIRRAAGGSRRGSKEAQAEEDEGNLMKALIEACDVSKPLADIAHMLRFDLEGILIPLARELVQNKKAILIDVVNTRLRTLVMPSTIVEHSTTLEDYVTSFSRAFPALPLLPVYLSQISAAPTPFRDLIPTTPSESDGEIPARQVYLDSLIWLLKHDLVIQVHTYVRIWARAEVKEIAWKRLWLRRRSRWINSRAGSLRARSERSHGSSGTSTAGDDEVDMITPRADKGNPIDAMSMSVPPPNGTREARRTPLSGIPSIPPTRSSSFPDLGQSFMDYDPELELDSDVGEPEGFRSDQDRLEAMNFSMELKEPERKDIPKFKGTFIFRPARAVKEEMRWLRVIREGADEVWASKFDLCVQYFDGATSFDEISYRTGLRLREIDWIVKLFKEDVVVLLHP